VALEDFEGKIHRRKYGPIPVNSQCRNRCHCAMYELYKGICVENTYSTQKTGVDWNIFRKDRSRTLKNIL